MPVLVPLHNWNSFLLQYFELLTLTSFFTRTASFSDSNHYMYISISEFLRMLLQNASIFYLILIAFIFDTICCAKKKNYVICLIEDYLDTLLVKTLGFIQNVYNNKLNRSRVIRIIR